MADTSDSLPPQELDALNDFLNAHVGEDGLLCPVTGEARPLTEWNAPAGAVVLPGKDGGPGYEAFPLTSAAGGVVLISRARLLAWQAEEKAKQDGEQPPP